MSNITEYLNENLDELVFELKGQTYLNAAKKAKKLGDPRSIKFLQAYKDNIDKEFMDAPGPDKENDRFLVFYNADKKSIQRLKGLGSTNDYDKVKIIKLQTGTALQINNVSKFRDAYVYVEYNEKLDKEVFLRQSLIDQGKWEKVSGKFKKLGDRINNIKAMKPFTYISIYTNDEVADFFYFIDDDEIMFTSIRNDEGIYKDDECLDHLSDNGKEFINTLCKLINTNHKDI